MLGYVTWTVDPILLHLGSLHVGWYGIFFAFGLVLIGPYIFMRMREKEGFPEEWVTSLFYYVILGTVLGARLGHCLFYQPEYYLSHPFEIIKIWEGGLASHGGVIGIIIAVFIYSKRVSHRSVLWTFDRLAVPTGLVAGMIRLGNLMNHEIYGHATDLPWAFRYITNISDWQAGAEPIFSAPSHPTQIYEAICYFLIFGICMLLYWRWNAQKYVGMIFGIFITLTFLARFFIEFVKNVQVSSEVGMFLNIGQRLSIPFVIIGILSIIYSLKSTRSVDKRLI